MKSINKKIIVILVIAIFLLSYKYKTSTDNATDIKITDYFPNKEVIKVYSGGFENEGFILLINVFNEDIVKVKCFNGTGIETLYKISNKQIERISSQEVEADKLFYDNTIDVTDSSGKILLKHPIKKGTKWKTDKDNSNEITAIDKEVDTPIGKLKTIEVSRYKNKALYGKTYYAKEYGMVKYEVLYNDNTVLYQELIKDVIYNVKDYNTPENLYELIHNK